MNSFAKAAAPQGRKRLDAVRSSPLILAVLLATCSGSPTSPPPPPAPAIDYTAPDATPNTVTLQQAAVSSTSLTLEVVATDLTGVSALFFDLVFNPNVLRFQSASEGNYFAGSGGTNFQAALDETSGTTNPGRLLVSASVLGGNSASGSGTIATIVVSRVGPGTTGTSFEAAGGLGPDFAPVPGLTFIGGAVSVR